VHQWVKNLPGPQTAIISLLGRKPPPKGTSEFSFYTFHGREDTPQERRGKRSLQEWLDHYHPERAITLIEHPTMDFRPIPDTALASIAADVDRLLAEGRTIVLVDSGGETRSGAVCRYLNLVEDPRT
jgi:hypothetical protein